jgi:hypothetical protein
MHPHPVRVFVSYSHRDASYLDGDSLLVSLKGLEKEGVEFWTDRHLVAGEAWDEVIKRRIAESDIALVLVSQAFLDSEYCTNTEIQGFLARSAVLFPVILSACEWERHEWLKSRQFLPGGGETIEEHYVEPGKRKSLFHKIRQQLREQIERVRATRRPSAHPGLPPNPFGQTLAIKDPAMFIGREAELRRLRTFLSGGSVSLQGEPKIGKSSVLWALARSWSGDVVGPLDFQGYDDLEDFYSDLAERLGLDSPRWRTLRNHLRERAVLLLLDELDAGPGRGFDGEALARFRSIGNQNPGFKIVAASRNPLKQLFPDGSKDSPGYNFLPPMTLGEFPADEARRLLEHPWDGEAPAFDDASLAEILELAGRHPFKLQRAAFNRYEVFADASYSWRDAWCQEMEHLL